MLEMTKVVQRQLGACEFQPREASGSLQRQLCLAFKRTAHPLGTIGQVGKQFTFTEYSAWVFLLNIRNPRWMKFGVQLPVVL